jgi:hypothetical protein
MGLLNYIPGFQASQFGGWWNNNNDAVSGALGGLVGHGNDPRDIMKGAVGGFQHGRSVDEEQAIIAEKTKPPSRKSNSSRPTPSNGFNSRALKTSRNTPEPAMAARHGSWRWSG